MPYILERVTNPSIEPVTLAEFKTHLRTYSSVTNQDDQLNELLEVARQWVENKTARALIDQTWRLTIGSYRNAYADVDSDTVIGYYRGPFIPRDDGGILLRKSPLIAITSFVSVAADGTETTIDASTYELREGDSKWPKVVPLSGAIWQQGMMRIEYRAGFADLLGSPSGGAADVPSIFKIAIKLFAEAHYDKDKDMMEKLVKAAEDILSDESSDVQMA